MRSSARHHRRKPVSSRTLVTLGIGLPVLLVLAVLTAWSVDEEEPDRVGRNITLAGTQVGGMTEPQVRVIATHFAVEYTQAAIRVEAPQGGFDTSSAELGVIVDVERTVASTLGMAHTGPLAGRIWGWVRSLFKPRPAPVRIHIDTNAVYEVIAQKDQGPRAPAAEPGIRMVNGRLKPVEGQPGTGIDPTRVIDALPRAADAGFPITVNVTRGRVPPRFTLEDARVLADRGEQLTARGLEVQAGVQQATVPPATLRSWMHAATEGGELVLKVDRQTATADLRTILDQPDPLPVDAAYDVVDGELLIVAGMPGEGCCADAAGEVVESAVLGSGPQAPVELPVTDIPPAVTTEQLASSGIAELVSTFTTNHAAGQPRVRNIQLMADMVRGQVIEPGASFSVNGFVGERTPEKGFVVDGVIEDGRFESSVGGGVSQFATTLFNAAFFAGLEFPEYQSHSLYISRYPFGREATLSFPKPDLIIRNPSAYPILIWPTYTASSITVGLYSTKWAEVEQTGQSETRRGPCRLVRTERTTTYLADNSTKVDRVNALYRPAEGVNCV